MSVAILQYIFQGGGGRKGSVCAPPPTPEITKYISDLAASSRKNGNKEVLDEEKPWIELFSSSQGRKVFVRELNRQRSLQKEVMKPERFEILIRLLFLFLDQSLESRDVKAVNMMMIMSQTFFRRKSKITDEEREKIESERDERKREVATRDFLQPYIARHRVWKELSFWEEAFLVSLREETLKNCNKFVRGMTKEDADHCSYLRRNFVFGGLSSQLLNMINFGIASVVTKRLILNMSVA
mgnify:FL=1